MTRDEGRRTDKKLTHFDKDGAARMVDVSSKEETGREAVAEGIARELRRDPAVVPTTRVRSAMASRRSSTARADWTIASAPTAERVSCQTGP